MIAYYNNNLHRVVSLTRRSVFQIFQNRKMATSSHIKENLECAVKRVSLAAQKRSETVMLFYKDKIYFIKIMLTKLQYH